ncbi:hypothetical protein PJN92_30010, partial [Mycobacterium kansasii]
VPRDRLPAAAGAAVLRDSTRQARTRQARTGDARDVHRSVRAEAHGRTVDLHRRADHDEGPLTCAQPAIPEPCC